jgi:membrane protease YdiL (CAAX protease family)
MVTADIGAGRAGEALRLERRRWVAIIAAPSALGVMYPIFQLMGDVFGERVDGRLGWAVGLAVYWLLWGVLCSWWLLGWNAMRTLVRPRKPDGVVLLLVVVPAAIAAIGRFAFLDVAYDPATSAALALLIIAALGNGLFEELFWRGVYLQLFREGRFLGVVWPSIWFGLWHLAPASLSGDDGAVRLVVGALVLGFYLSFIARRSASAWWAIVAHTLIAFVVIW